MVEGIDFKEPQSPRIADGEYIEEECKFLPPPKSVAHPRLFLVKADGATEFSNAEQLEYLFRNEQKNQNSIRSKKSISVNNEPAITHVFLHRETKFNPTCPTHLPENPFPKFPSCLELVNQTVSISAEPDHATFLTRNIIEFNQISAAEETSINGALQTRDNIRSAQQQESERLEVP